MQSYLKYLIWGCLLAVPFLALYVSDGSSNDLLNWGTSGLFFPFISGKNIVFRALVEIAFFAWIALAIKDTTYRLKKTPLLIAYGVFIVVLFFADYFGVDRVQSFWSNFERMEGFFGHIHLFAYFVVLSACLRSLNDWKTMFRVSVAANALVLATAFGQLFGVKEFFFAKMFPSLAGWFATSFPVHMATTRLDSTLGNSAYLAIYTLLYAFILALLYVWSTQSWHKKAYAVLIALNLVIMFYTGTRGTMIGLAVGAFVTLVLIALKGDKESRKLVIGTLVGLSVVTAGIFICKDTSFVQSSPTLARIASISPKDVTTMGRLSIWQISYEAWKERPLLGYGQDNFTHIFARKFIPEKMWNLEPWYDRSHNVFFDWLVAAGVFGLLSYLSLFVIAAWMTWRKGSQIPFNEKAILTGAFTGYFIHNIFVFDNLISYVLFILLLVYIAWRAAPGEAQEKHKPSQISEDAYVYGVVPLVTVIGLISFYLMVYKPFALNVLLIRGLDFNRLVSTMSTPDALRVQRESFTAAVGMNIVGSREAREQFIQSALRATQIQVPPTLSQQEKQAFVQAENDLIQATRNEIIASYPSLSEDVRALAMFGSFFNGVQDYVSAEQVLTRALTLSPEKQILAFELIKTYLLSNKAMDAYLLAKKVYESAPAFPDALKWYVVSSAYAHTFDTVKKDLTAKGVGVPLDADVISSLVQNGDIKNAREMLYQYKAQNPAATAEVDKVLEQIGKGIK